MPLALFSRAAFCSAEAMMMRRARANAIDLAHPVRRDLDDANTASLQALANFLV